MNVKNSRPCGDFRTSYRQDMSMFEDKKSFYFSVLGIVFLLFSPLYLDAYLISLLIYIGFYAIAALGLNILVGLGSLYSLESIFQSPHYTYFSKNFRSFRWFVRSCSLRRGDRFGPKIVKI